ncbi:mitochondrial coenzyme A diphosphatase NUDT8-like isoform 2-T3 [Anomaloglossus baeobatrachus]|uniref:mitochondrial coenzyme A diphosphatase NUDT8-like isoform X2 n=1 Tax=Anomaloglossus baeobatrachus TaxID=238106 RepID=UPI003F503D62
MFLRPALLSRSLCTKDFQQLPNEALTDGTEQRCRQILGKTALPQRVSAGVLVTLCTSRGTPAFLYTLRSSKLKGRHKGDVSFPGGKFDSSDADAIDTALREAQEELGITLPRSTVWGPMKPITDWTGMVIVPVLANIGCLEDLAANPNPEEVSTVLQSDFCILRWNHSSHFHFHLRVQAPFVVTHVSASVGAMLILYQSSSSRDTKYGGLQQ